MRAGTKQRENIVKLGSIVNLGSGCALRINDDSALLKLPKLLKLSKLPILALITEGRGKAQRENLGKLGSIVNLGSGCALRINADSAPP